MEANEAFNGFRLLIQSTALPYYESKRNLCILCSSDSDLLLLMVRAIRDFTFR